MLFLIFFFSQNHLWHIDIFVFFNYTISLSLLLPSSFTYFLLCLFLTLTHTDIYVWEKEKHKIISTVRSISFIIILIRYLSIYKRSEAPNKYSIHFRNSLFHSHFMNITGTKIGKNKIILSFLVNNFKKTFSKVSN